LNPSKKLELADAVQIFLSPWQGFIILFIIYPFYDNFKPPSSAPFPPPLQNGENCTKEFGWTTATTYRRGQGFPSFGGNWKGCIKSNPQANKEHQ